MVSNIQQPTHLVSRLQQDFNDLFRPFSDKPSPLPNLDDSAVTGQWIPPVNIHQADSQFFISLNIPRFDAKDIELSINDGVLLIHAERKLHPDQYRNGYYRNQSARDSFYRRFSLPEAADPEKLSTKFRDGILTITLARRAITKQGEKCSSKS